jgi:hypothetical protein
MNRRLPTFAILLGILMLVPFLGFGLAAMRATTDESRMFGALMYWGALMLAFFGAVHWGFALDQAAPIAGSSAGERWRLLLGVVPAAIGWAALIIALFGPPDLGLAVLIAGFIATIVAEDQGRRTGLVPGHYTWLRWLQSVVIVALLVTVLVVRLLGARLVF